MPLTQEARHNIEVVVSNNLSYDWERATSVAAKAGLPWQPVSAALQRLHQTGKIDGKEIEWKDKRCRIKKSHEYRAQKALAEMPGWFGQRVVPVPGGAARMIIGMGMMGGATVRTSPPHRRGRQKLYHGLIYTKQLQFEF